MLTAAAHACLMRQGVRHKLACAPGELLQSYDAMAEEKSSWSLPRKEVPFPTCASSSVWLLPKLLGAGDFANPRPQSGVVEGKPAICMHSCRTRSFFACWVREVRTFQAACI